MYECQEGCSRYCGPKTSIALTNTRIISRHQEPNKCCCCCCEAAHLDTTVFLTDIELMREAKQQTATDCGALLVVCLTGTCLCFLCALCCGSCCGDRPKPLEVKGGFNSEYFIFKTPDVPSAANEITSLILPFKNRQ
jgi:hypothetical protein